MLFKTLKKLLELDNLELLVYLGTCVYLIASINDDIHYNLIKKSDLQKITIEHVTALWSTKETETSSRFRIGGGVLFVYQQDGLRYRASCGGADRFCGIRQETRFQDATVVLLWAPNKFDFPSDHPRGPLKFGFIKEISSQGNVIFKNDESGLDTYISTIRGGTIFDRIVYLAAWIASVWLLFKILRKLFMEEE